jgi:outer membrane receptor protein involved in Fe transport
LLDQDRAVRSANLAAIYRDDGMIDWSVREASRAVSYDYANYSAHLFLSESYDALRDPKQINLRYETPWFSELLVSQLLAPVGAGNLSQYVSQQEYSKLFERDRFGLSSSTEYFSSGDWNTRASQFGTFGNFSYAFDVEHRSENGQRPNNDLRQTTLYAKFKYQITPQDSLFLEVQGYDAEFGDVAQYYNQNGRIPNVRAPSPTFRGSERQEPNLFAGFHHEWTPGLHTLLLTGRLDDTLEYHDANALIPFYRYTAFTREPFSVMPLPFEVDYRREFEAYTAELQQIWQIPQNTVVAGARYQIGWADTTSQVDYPFNVPSLISSQDFSTELERISFYAYDQWQPFDSLLLSAGVSYDHLNYPRNIDTSPITDDETSKEQVSPKAGIIWSPLPDTHLRGAYTRSLGGVFYDTSVRLEPTQVGGFNQAFRSIAPESAVGLVPGTEFETWGAGLDHSFKKTGTYFSVEGEILSSEATRTYGVVTNRAIGVPTDAASTRQSLDFEERSLTFIVNQLIGKEWSLGARYRVSYAELDARFIDIPSTVLGLNQVNQDEEAILHQLNLFAIYNCPCGFFSRAEAIWSQQSNRGYTPDIPGDEFWQFNLYAGYRFWHRAAEVRIGLLNITDQNYRLNPLNLYYELPRERTLSVSCKIYF